VLYLNKRNGKHAESPDNRSISTSGFFINDKSLNENQKEEMGKEYAEVIKNGTFKPELVCDLLYQVSIQPSAIENLTILVIENMNVERIFYYTQYCVNIVAVYTKGNRIITRDLPYLCKLQKLVKADLSNCNIHFLPEELYKLENIKILLLSGNHLIGWKQLAILVEATTLRLLTLYGNPCMKVYGARTFLITHMPHLWALDNLVVSDFERQLFKDIVYYDDNGL
jgi:Leucine-rich repeat (LRR) protein